MIHNASIEKYRAPIGAVKKGEEITLRLFGVPEQTTDAEIITYGEDFHREHKMKMKGEVCERTFRVPEKAGVVWYYFKIWEGNHHYYYGARPGRSQGEGIAVGGNPYSFQITVYEKDFDTPRWMSRGIMYQIFPDRFCKGNPKNLERGEKYHKKMGRDVYVHDNWEERPLFGPLPGKQFYDPCDYFGGDLQGIISRLDDLKKLGVTCIYLNPIGEAASNHRYNTSDYKKVDPFLGTNEDFKRLCRIAREKRIHIILDGVYSHTGDDSVYFNKKENYAGKGAWQGPESPYYDWYHFDEEKNYDSWWGFQSLPEVDEMNRNFVNYIITGKNSVIKHWLSMGASGFRLDVADELPDEFIFTMRKTLKSLFKNYALIGEVWEDATTKESYGVKRKYALGGGLDSTMNYPFKVNTVSFLLGDKNAYGLQEFLLEQQCNYPQPLYYAVMNLLSSHDIARIRTTLATGMNETMPSREAQIDYVITSKMDQKGAKLARLAMAIQFFVPGMPSIYYGDEYGMHGFMDPFNRGTYYKNDKKTYEELKIMTDLRSRERALQTGYAMYFAVNENVLGILRFTVGGQDIFGEKAENKAFLMLVNRSSEEERAAFDLRTKKEGVPRHAHSALIQYLSDPVVHEKIGPWDYKVVELK